MIIYKITNNKNDRVYIGQSINSLQERIWNYKKEYKHSKHRRPILDAMRKYGFENFSFEIIAETNSQEKLDELEKYYIKEYHSLCSENGYNIELGGNGFGKHSEETKRKISVSQLGVKNHMYGKIGKDNVTSKPVIELTTDSIYESASIAGRELNLSFSHICSCCRGTRGSVGGYVFRYLNEDNTIYQPEKITYIKSFETKNKVLPKYQYLIELSANGKS